MSYAQNTENQEEVKYESKSWIGYENRKENERNRLQKTQLCTTTLVLCLEKLVGIILPSLFSNLARKFPKLVL